MPQKPSAQYVNCIHCTRGPKGEQSCASGMRVRTVNGGGCFLGAWLPGKVPAKVDGVKVEQIEAKSYDEAWLIALDKGHRQFIWVKEGIPQASRSNPT